VAIYSCVSNRRELLSLARRQRKRLILNQVVMGSAIRNPVIQLRVCCMKQTQDFTP
jgi:hypothetical protein